jgi:hypothetical protein
MADENSTANEGKQHRLDFGEHRRVGRLRIIDVMHGVPLPMSARQAGKGTGTYHRADAPGNEPHCGDLDDLGFQGWWFHYQWLPHHAR